MNQITREQAFDLAKYRYKLVDKDGYISCIHTIRPSFIQNDGLMLGLTNGNVAVLSDIGKDYFILCRNLSQLTETIEHEGESFVPIHKLFEIEYFGTQHALDIRNQYYTKTGRFITSSHFGTAADTSINILTIDSNNNWKTDKLQSWHFNLDFPQETVKPL